MIGILLNKTLIQQILFVQNKEKNGTFKRLMVDLFIAGVFQNIHIHLWPFLLAEKVLS